MRGIFHVHSEFSSGSELSIPQITKNAKQNGYDFVCLVEHQEDVDDFEKYIKKCRENSSSSVEIIPGIEIRTKRAHILAIGIQQAINSDRDIQKIVNEIHEKGGLAGVAHLSYKCEPSKLPIDIFDFLEVWNYAYDKLLPQLENIRVWQKHENIYMIGGLDAHSLRDFGSIELITKTNNVMEDLSNGLFYSKGFFFSLKSNSFSSRDKIALLLKTTAYLPLLGILRLLFKIKDATGIEVPESISKKGGHLLRW